MAEQVRIEKDSMGDVRVPADRMWGASTQRAVENFRVSGRTLPRGFLDALVAVKWASPRRTRSWGSSTRSSPTRSAPPPTRSSPGSTRHEFRWTCSRPGPATSSNMNVNKVISNLANVRLGGKPGDKKPVHPNDVVNMGQSSNDAVRPRSTCRWPRRCGSG